jgi:hypothetical protein
MGLANAVSRLKDSKAKSKVVILLTDGSNNMGDIWHWVKASPANIVRPILSFGLPAINSAATAFAASILFGFKSSAIIVPDISRVNIISIPSVLSVRHELDACGRASAMTTIVIARQRKTKGT